MNVAAIIAVSSIAIAVAVALYGLRLGATPGWSVYRWLAAIAAGSAAYGIGNLASSTGQPDELVRVATRLQLAGMMVELWGWFHFADEDTGLAPPPWERWLRRALLLLAALALVPGVAYDAQVFTRRLPAWGIAYREVAPTRFGAVVFAVGLAGAVWIVVRLHLAWRRGVRVARLHGMALTVLLALAVNDALAALGFAPTPYLLDLGFLVPLAALFWSQGERLIQEATQLRELRDRLEWGVVERTAQLAAANRSLQQAERLAALGHFAAGIAQRFDGPAGVVQATLNRLHEAIATGRPPTEAPEAILEAREAMRRIAHQIHQRLQV